MRRSLLLLLILGCAGEPSRDESPPPTEPQKPPGESTPPARPAPIARPEPKPDPSIRSTAAIPVETAPGARPAISAVWEFGILSPGTEARHRYTITNPSTITWTIQSVSKSCSCTAGEFSQRVVKPGETTWLEVTFRASDREGPLQQSLVVEFAEPAPTATLVMKGEIRRILAAVPPSLDLGRLASNARLNREIEVRNHGDRDLTLDKIEAPDWLQAEVVPVKKDGLRQAWKLTLRAEPGKLKPGPAVGTVIVRTNSDKVGPLLIPVSVERKATLEAIPDSVTFDAVEVGKTSLKTILIDVDAELGELSEKDLVVTHTFGNELEMRLSPAAQKNRFMLVAVFKPVQSKGDVKGKLEITTRQGTVPPAVVKLYGAVR